MCKCENQDNTFKNRSENSKTDVNSWLMPGFICTFAHLHICTLLKIHLHRLVKEMMLLGLVGEVLQTE